MRKTPNEKAIHKFLKGDTFKLFFKIILKYKYLLILVIILRLLGTIMSLAWAEANRILFDEITSLTMKFCIGIVLSFLFIKIFNMFLNYVNSWAMSYLNESVINKMRWILLKKSVSIPYPFFENTHMSRLYKVFFTDLETLRDLMLFNLLDIICLPLSFLGIGAYLFTIHPLLALISIIVGPLQLISNLVKLKEFQAVVKELNEFDYKFFRTMQETVQGIREIKENTMEEETVDGFSKLCDEGRTLDVKKVKISTFRDLIKNLPNEMAFIVGIIVTLYLMFKGEINLGGFVAFTTLLGVISGVFSNIVNTISKIHEAIANTEDLCMIMEMESEILNDGYDLEPHALSLSFSNISFSYKDNVPVFTDLSFKIPSNSTVAIVGPSGSGKSTIIKLIQRFYMPDSGEIKVNGKLIQDYSLLNLRSRIAVVPQDIFLYASSIGENIAIANPNATMEEIENVAKMADIHNFISLLPEQYDTEVGERGVNLSQGQKQRIAIARALLKQSFLLILDEATSALDVETEDVFQNNFTKYTNNCTKIIIAHRLATIKEADYVVFIDEGKVLEQGTPEQLLAKGGKFRKFWDKQINVKFKSAQDKLIN
ncbi:MAG: ABC transporter ATP-binding protein [Clostridia bacterium]